MDNNSRMPLSYDYVMDCYVHPDTAQMSGHIMCDRWLFPRISLLDYYDAHYTSNNP